MSFGFNQSEQSVTDERSVRNGNKLFENSVGNKSLFGLIQAGHPLVQLLHPSEDAVLMTKYYQMRKETEELH